MPSCSENHKHAMTGGGVRSMLRRAGAGLRKLTKRNKAKSLPVEQEMVSMGPRIATTRFGSKSKYNNRAVHRQSVEDLETHVVDLKQQVAELEKANEIAQSAHSNCISREKERAFTSNNILRRTKLGRDTISKVNTKLVKENEQMAKELDTAVSKLGETEQKLAESTVAHVRDYERFGEASRKQMYELAVAKEKLAECEAGKESGSRRRKAAVKMYRQAHVDRTIAAVDTEEALEKAIATEEAFVKAENAYKALKTKYDTAVAHSGTKSEKVTELGMKLNAAAEKVKQLEKELKKAQKSAELNKGKYETMDHAATILDKKAAKLESNLVDARESLALAEKKSALRKFAQNIAHGALSMEQKRAANARDKADAALGMLDKVVTAAKSDQRRLASTERRTQRRFPISELNIARGASRMSLKRSIAQTNAVAARHDAFMAQQQGKATMDAYRASRRANAASAKKTANKAKALEANNSLTRAMKSKQSK